MCSSDLKKTHNMPKGDRARSVQEVQNIQGLILERHELNRLVVPPPSNPAIPVLQEPKKDGIKCQFPDGQGSPCKYISRHLQQIQEHYEKEHSWVNPQKRGRPESGSEVQVPWKTGVHCQHFFVRGPGAQFFEV